MTRCWTSLLALTLALLTGCAGLAPVAQPEATARLAGRISIQVEGSGAGAAPAAPALNSQGGPESGSLELSTPLGAIAARAQWQPGAARLQTPEQDREFADL